MLKLTCLCTLTLLVNEQRFSSPTANPASVKVLKHLNFRKANGAEEPIELIYAMVGHICQLNQLLVSLVILTTLICAAHYHQHPSGL